MITAIVALPGSFPGASGSAEGPCGAFFDTLPPGVVDAFVVIGPEGPAGAFSIAAQAHGYPGPVHVPEGTDAAERLNAAIAAAGSRVPRPTWILRLDLDERIRFPPDEDPAKAPKALRGMMDALGTEPGVVTLSVLVRDVHPEGEAFAHEIRGFRPGAGFAYQYPVEAKPDLIALAKAQAPEAPKAEGPQRGLHRNPAIQRPPAAPLLGMAWIERVWTEAAVQAHAEAVLRTVRTSMPPTHPHRGLCEVQALVRLRDPAAAVQAAVMAMKAHEEALTVIVGKAHPVQQRAALLNLQTDPYVFRVAASQVRSPIQALKILLMAAETTTPWAVDLWVAMTHTVQAGLTNALATAVRGTPVPMSEFAVAWDILSALRDEGIDPTGKASDVEANVEAWFARFMPVDEALGARALDDLGATRSVAQDPGAADPRP